jgi:hypothetical protein
MEPDNANQAPDPQMPDAETPRQPRKLRPFESPEVERQERIDYLKSITPAPKPKRTWLRIMLIVLGVLVVAAGAYFVITKALTKKDTPAASNDTAKTSKTQTAVVTKTKHFDSSSLGLGLDYPETWKASEANNKVTVISPAMQLKTASGTSKSGQAVVTIQPKQTTLDTFKKGNGLAALSSERVSYTKPSQTQRAQTYLSFVQYPTSTVSGIDAIYITGDNGYQKDQAVPQVDIVQVDPLVSVTFLACSGSCAGTGQPLTVASSTWSDATAVAKMLRSLLTSLAIQ